MEIEVFKTNVFTIPEAQQLIGEIRQYFPNFAVNFDLEDCDKILRVEGEQIQNETIIEILRKQGFKAEVLD